MFQACKQGWQVPSQPKYGASSCCFHSCFAQTQQHQQQRSLARLTEQLQGCTQEAAALKRQLGDREAELRQLRLQAARAGDGPRSAARRFSGMPGPAASGSSSSKHLTPL